MDLVKEKMQEVKLATFSNNNFNKGAGKLKWFLWLLVSSLILKPSWIPFMGVKILLLKLFGAKIGEGLVIKPSVNIKFPWKLVIGNDVWIGENVWIDNLDAVTVGNDVCISQGALLLTGNHDYTLTTFDYKNLPILLENGVWIGAKSLVCPGVICKSHAILAAGSVATNHLDSYTIYQGNPAKEVRKRRIKK